MIASPTLLILGLILLLIGLLMMSWASNRNLKDVAIGAALGAGWTLLWKRQRPGVPEELTSRVEEVRAQGTHLGKAKVVTGYAVKHVVAQVVGLVGIVVLLVGGLLVVLGVFWR
jgi:uncharacterized membrane protein